MALNKFHSSIKFTITTSQSTVNYLDLTISKNNTPNNRLVLTIQTYENQIICSNTYIIPQTTLSLRLKEL